MEKLRLLVFVPSLGEGTKEMNKGAGGSGKERRLQATARWLDRETDLDSDHRGQALLLFYKGVSRIHCWLSLWRRNLWMWA